MPVNGTFVYQAKKDAPGGTFQIAVTGVALSANGQDPLNQLIGQPLAIPVPQLLIAFNTDVCYGGPNQPYSPLLCPQFMGNKYTISRNFAVSYNFTTSAVNKITIYYIF